MIYVHFSPFAPLVDGALMRHASAVGNFFRGVRAHLATAERAWFTIGRRGH